MFGHSIAAASLVAIVFLLGNISNYIQIHICKLQWFKFKFSQHQQELPFSQALVMHRRIGVLSTLARPQVVEDLIHFICIQVSIARPC